MSVAKTPCPPALHVMTGVATPWSPPGSAVELDLGCGRGGFLLDLAQAYPERLILGADIMLGRLRKVVNKAKTRGLTNIELLRVDAWALVGNILPDHCLLRVHVLCPDPWPKKRHRANRLLTSEFLGRLATKIVPGGILHLATDDEPYLAAMRAAIADLSGYRLDPEGLSDLGGMQTDFERGFAKLGRDVHHLAYRCCGGAMEHVEQESVK